MSKWMLIVVLVASPLVAHAASEPDPLSCEALTAGKSKNDEENIKILARAIPEASAKHLTDGVRKEWLKRGANEYAAFSASLDYLVSRLSIAFAVDGLKYMSLTIF